MMMMMTIETCIHCSESVVISDFFLLFVLLMLQFLCYNFGTFNKTMEMWIMNDLIEQFLNNLGNGNRY